MAEGILDRIKSLAGGKRERAPLSGKQLAQLRQQLRECAAGTGGEVSARNRAAKLGETYLALDDAGRHEFLRRIALDFGPEPAKVDAAHRAYQAAVGTPGQWDAEADEVAGGLAAAVALWSEGRPGVHERHLPPASMVREERPRHGRPSGQPSSCAISSGGFAGPPHHG
mgnify:CR=1 FL=1